MLEKFSLEAQKLIAVAESLAFDLACSFIGSEHLFLAFLKLREGMVAKWMKEREITYELFLKEVKKQKKEERDIYFMEYTESFKLLLEKAVLRAKENKEDRVSIETLGFVLLSEEDGLVSEFLTTRKVEKKELMAQLSKATKKRSELDNIMDLHDLSKIKKDPLIGRKRELDQLIRALIRRNKPNALLLGKPGIGKTAIVEELAHLLAENKIKGLEEKRIYELDLSSVVGGTKYRGEFEEKLKKIIKKVKEDGNAILFIDEIHNIIKAGGAEGAIDASNILKPYLSRGEIQVIGATTIDEYHAIFSKDKALSRRFQVIKVDPSTPLETKGILHKLLPIYEEYYHIKIPQILVDFIVDVAEEYLPERAFPDKAIDILDNSCVIAKEKLTRADIVSTMDSFFHISIDIERKALVTKQDMEKHIYGQDKAIQRIYRWLHMVECGVHSSYHPLAVLLFVGPSGVGKSEAAKLIAKNFLHNEDAFIRLDMASFQESSSLNKLIGAAPGYMGAEKKSSFVKQIHSHPNAVVLLDEIDKAHLDVCDFFLNVFDEGYFLDSDQEKVDCSNMIFILTSNQGFDKGEIFSKQMHFYTENRETDLYEKLSSKFRLEFLNRIDDIILFEYLSKETKQQLIQKYVQEIVRKTSIEISDDLFLDENDINDTDLARFGARYIRRLVLEKVSCLLEDKEKMS